MTTPSGASPATTPAAGSAGGSNTAAPPAGVGNAGLISALQLVLQAENAAIWSYALVGTADAKNAATADDMHTAHLVLRDAAAEQVTQLGGSPNPPAAAYTIPTLPDVATAQTFAQTIESDCAEAWRSVIGNTDDQSTRTFASGALSGAAVRIVRWRKLAKASPVTVAFPGTAS